MKPYRKLIVWVFVILIAESGSAQLNLENDSLVTVGDDPRRVYNELFSYEEALKRVGLIDEFLDSFRTLVEKYKDRFSEEELRNVRHTGWETQNIGFPNVTGTLEGAIRKQHYLLKKMEYELAKYQLAAGEIGEKEVTEKKTEFKETEKNFQTFWDSFRLSD